MQLFRGMGQMTVCGELPEITQLLERDHVCLPFIIYINKCI